MKKSIFKLLPIGLLLYTFVSCEKEIWENPEREGITPELTVSEARACFEERISSIATRSGVSLRKSGLNADFTPIWNKAVIKSTTYSSFVTVPINSDVKIGAWYKEWQEKNRCRFPGMRVYQKLIVMKDRQGKMAPYVMSFIPDKYYYIKHKGNINPEKWNQGGDFGDFTGLVAYTLPNADCPVRVDKYTDGQKTDGASVFDFVKGRPGELRKMLSFFNQFRFKQSPLRVSTRSDGFEEDGSGDDNWDFDNNPGEYIGNIGGSDFWLHTDSNGNENLVYDRDGDGKPDSVWLNPADATPDNNDNDYDPFPDIEDPWENQPDPGTGGSTGGGGGIHTGDHNNVPKEIAPNAKKLFRNSHMTDANWARVESMLEKIMKDCMGGKLYNELVRLLDGKTFTIQFDPTSRISYFRANGETAGITLHTGESNILLHEMFHAYQAYQETYPTMKESSLNREIEAWFVQYLYVKKLPEFTPGSKWHTLFKKYSRGMAIAGIERFITSQGKLKPGVDLLKLEEYILNQAARALRQAPSYKNKPYDYDRSGLDNFKNLRELSKDC